jgi:glutamyl-tRNA synthetase
MVTVRFAPAPTGLLHVGSIRPALFNFLFARKEGGRFILRIDDTDKERSQEQYVEAIKEDLAWLAIGYDDMERQSARVLRYAAAAERLRSAGRLYPCYETADELERKRRRQMARGEAPVYDRAALKLTDAERAKLEAEGRKPHWRFFLGEGLVAWDDLIRRYVEIDLASISDPVLVRSDGQFLYTLPSVVDDIQLAITHIIRGEDHVTNTAPQIALFRALGAEPPHFAHHPLLLAADGGPLSKRLGSLAIADMRREGYEPLALLSLLAKIGTSDPVEPAASLDALVREFDFGKIGRAPARFDEAELKALNARALHHMAFADAAPRLAALHIPGDARFWEAVRGNLGKLSDAQVWWQVVNGPIEPVLEDRALTEKAAGLVPEGAFDEETWGVWTKALSAATGAKGRALFHPLRLALTGRPDGPEMKKLLVLIGPERARARLLGKRA